MILLSLMTDGLIYCCQSVRKNKMEKIQNTIKRKENQSKINRQYCNLTYQMVIWFLKNQRTKQNERIINLSRLFLTICSQNSIYLNVYGFSKSQNIANINKRIQKLDYFLHLLHTTIDNLLFLSLFKEMFQLSQILILIFNRIIKQLTFRKYQEMETPFIKKVKKILQDPQNVDVVCWNTDKTMIQIRNQKIFEQRVLTRHFRHNRISSFIRQLNLYGFKKIRSAQHRTFTHPILERGLGLQSIINKKKKNMKNSQENIDNDSIDIEPTHQKHRFESNQNLKKEFVSDYRISQNLIFNRENQKEDRTLLSINNISNPQQCQNTVWLVPVQSMQQNTWNMPCFKSPQTMFMNYNYLYYQN